MKGRILILTVCALTAVSVSAQSRTVTNLDLEKYRTARVSAERELNTEYERLGFPSPQERARRDADAAKRRDEALARFRAEELEQERIDAQLRAAEAYAEQLRAARGQVYGISTTDSYSDAHLGYWYGGRYYRRFRPQPYPQQYQQPGYFAGGQFWPTGPQTPPQPLIRVAPRNH